MKLYINENHRKGHINPEIYGHFSEHLGRCIYEGLYVGEDSEIPNINGMRTDVVEALKEIKIPVLRWPGGCFADEYHWKDGIGPKAERKKMVNTNWGGVTEDNSFGTHEFFELCDQLGCKTYVNGNVGSGTVYEMSEWVEYMTFAGESPLSDLRKKNGRQEPWTVDYFGVGNENWGCGGNMTPQQYGQEYRRYQTFIKNYNKNQPIFKICGGPDATDYNWTDVVLEECFKSPAPESAHGFMDGFSVHYYVGVEKGEHKGSATEFDADTWYATMKRAYGMEELISRHSAIMDKYDPKKKIGMMVDEWGCWHDVEIGTNPGFLYQQNTMRDAVVAALSLNIMNNHCDRVKMGCIAQVVNVLQSVVLTEGKKMIKTPTWYVFHMYRHHQDADLVYSYLSDVQDLACEHDGIPEVIQSVSVGADGVLTATLTSLSLEQDREIEVVLTEKKPESVEVCVLAEVMNAHNTFEAPDQVKEEVVTDYELTDRGVKVTLPACSVMSIRIK